MLTADKIIRMLPQRCLQRLTIPQPRANEMMQTIIIDLVCSRRHRLNALAVARANQPGDVRRTHPTPGLVSKSP